MTRMTMTPMIHTQQKRCQVSFCALSSRGCIDEPLTTKKTIHILRAKRHTYRCPFKTFRSPLLQSCKTCPINHRAYPFRVPTRDILVEVARSYEFDVARTDVSVARWRRDRERRLGDIGLVQRCLVELALC
jgi:hypothetical protein